MSHDASVAVIEDGEILFAAHSERSSKVKNYKHLTDDMINEALSHGKPDVITFYEQPWWKKSRQLYAGQYRLAFDMEKLPKRYLKRFPQLDGIPIKCVDHHLSHAAAGALTSDFDEACVVVIDAIGEWECLTVWKYEAPCTFTKVYSQRYPNSLGLLYTAFTQRVGLKPNEDEYILMGMAAYGDPKYKDEIIEDFFVPDTICELRHNTHRGIGKYLEGADDMDIAASIQEVIEEKIEDVIAASKELVGLDNLVYMGGVALNCVANSNILHKHYDNVWIMPNPGDAGSSLGSAAYYGGRKLNWESPYLGHEIKGDYPVESVLAEILEHQVCGVANGKAEFGPRALGNRSLLGDPRGKYIKDRLNEVKKRQKFRPFAPAVLEEHAHLIFDMPCEESRYMQYVAHCKYPELYPGIVHEDGTSRVQTVSEKDNPDFYRLIKRFYELTGCPMLVNTSLNIKGQPIVDDENDARDFETKYGIKVFTKEDK